jgi:TPR repeat protein
LHSEGRGVAKDDAQALQWFRKGAEQGNALAEYHLGVSLAEGRGAARDWNQALKWLKSSARQGLELARDYLWANGNITVDATK